MFGNSKSIQFVAIIAEVIILFFLINVIIENQYSSIKTVNPDTNEETQYFGNAVNKSASGKGRLFDHRGNLIY